MQRKIRLSILFLFTFFILQTLPSFTVADNRTDSFSEIVRFQKGELIINAQETRLSEILDEIYANSRIKIMGLEERGDEPVTFSSKGEPEDVLRRLLRHLKESNYAFEFSDIQLIKISVLPKSKGHAASSYPVQREEAPKSPAIQVVKVRGIVEGSQAEELGLMEGDIVVDYDGVKITNAQQLVREVKKKEKNESIDMTTIRDNIPMRFTLKGGMIGVNITTARISKEAIGE